VEAIYRYGSAGTIYEREESDIDIALLADKKITFKEISNLSVALMEATGRDIDLHDMRSLPVTLKVQIVIQGRRLYSSNRLAAESYDTYVLSDYVRLNEERQGILKEITQSGQIYG
jgi:predicted nucleotidyltransferase